MAKHRVNVPPSVRSVIVLAVLGAVSATVILALIGPGSSDSGDSGAERSVPQAEATAAPVSPAPPSASPSAPTAVASAAALPLTTPSPRTSGRRAPSSAPVARSTFTGRYVVTMSRNDGFIAGFEVTNTGGTAAQWTVEITYSGTVRVSDQIWNATVERTGNTYRFRAKSGTALGPSQKAQFGYSASGPRGSSRPVRCTVNGRACVS